MNPIIISMIVLGTIGLVFGLGLAYLSRKFAVSKDPKIKIVRALLPGINCGSCGYAGCDAFAEALIKDKEDFKKCAPGISKHTEIAKALGQESVVCEDRKVARLYCHGDLEKCSERFDYKGVEKCSTAASLSAGPKSCSYGCLGLADCVRICPVGAIMMDDKKLPVIDEDICIGCGKCVEECPKNLYELVSISKKVYVKCSSKDKAKDVIKNCKVGCIDCKICEKTCKFDAIHVVDNIAKVDYNKCVNCGACVLKCPRKIIMHIGKNISIKNNKSNTKGIKDDS